MVKSVDCQKWPASYVSPLLKALTSCTLRFDNTHLKMPFVANNKLKLTYNGTWLCLSWTVLVMEVLK